MRRGLRRIWLRCLAGAVIGGGLFATYLYLRDDAGPAGILDNWDEIVLAGAVGALVAWAMDAWNSWQHFRAVRQLVLHLEQSWKNPSRQPVLERPREEIVPLLGPVEAACGAYRQALAERVALQESVESLQNLLGQVDAGKGLRVTVRGSGLSRNLVGRLTSNLHWITATPALLKFLNATAEEINARPFLESVHPEDQERLRGVFDDAEENGEAHNIICRLLPRGGNADDIRHVTVDVLTRYDDNVHFRCLFEDVTDRVRAELELRRRSLELSQTNDRLRQMNQDLERLKESYRDLYHHAPVMYFSLDAAGKFVTFNETLLAALGYEREDLFKQPYTRLLTPARREEWDTAFGAVGTVVTTATPVKHVLTREGEVETQWVKKDGSIIDVWIRSVPLEDEEGRFVRSRSAALNMTERNRLANELRARGDQLERANVELRQINRELEEFTSVVSHDLKEPLRTLQAFSNFLAEDYSGQLGPDGFQYINHLVGASKRLGSLIDDLLKLSSAGRITHDLQAIDMNDIAATIRRDLADLIQRRNAQLIVEGPLPTAIGDPPRIAQLLANLVGNALKYNASASPVVIIGRGEMCPSATASGAYFSTSRTPAWMTFPQVTLFVRDNGIGIDPRYHEQIFGIFRRLHTADEYEGTGAGLAICKKIVEGHAGRIWVESQPGQGATFYFTLPAAPVIPPPVEMPARTTMRLAQDSNGASLNTPCPSSEEKAESQAPTFATAIVLVEDMAEIALIVQKVSQRAGHQILWLRTAQEAWQRLKNERPRLVLLDIHLTDMSGKELCPRLRTLPHLAGVPIALFTQGAMDDDQARSLGADRVLSKDLLSRPDDWLAQLDDALHARERTTSMPVA